MVLRELCVGEAVDKGSYPNSSSESMKLFANRMGIGKLSFFLYFATFFPRLPYTSRAIIKLRKAHTAKAADIGVHRFES